MLNKILVIHGEGIGNCVSIIPTIRTIKESLGIDVDYFHAFGSFPIPKVIPYVDKWFTSSDFRNIDFSAYVGVVSTCWTTAHVRSIPLPLLNTPTALSPNRSEVDTYMDIARNLGAKDNQLLWYGECLYNEMDEVFDIVVHDGYNPYGAADWKVKSYPHYEEVVKKLISDGLCVCSVGSGREYINGTENRTGLDLLSTLGLMKNSKLFLGNDSGLYHCANALGVKNVVIFTATSTAKNYDTRFHIYSTLIVRGGLECRPCQHKKGWKSCERNWECREIPPDTVYNTVVGEMDYV